MQHQPPIRPAQLAQVGFLFSIILITSAFGWTALLHQKNILMQWYPSNNAGREILLGLILGISGANLIWMLHRYLASIRRMRNMLIQLIDFRQMNWLHALLFGLMAGFPEEMFFRGAMQPRLGILITALIFGILHAMTSFYLLYAFLMGVGLGMLVAWRGDLWAATMTHFSYDAMLFLLMIWHVRKNPSIIGD